MNYLKCTSCGHQNALKSAYLTFCGHCAKKLPGNYTSWLEKYPGMSFEDYQEALAQQASQENNALAESKTSKWWIAGALLAVLLITGGTLFGKRAVLTLFYKNAPQGWLHTSWQTAVIGRQALEISSPVQLRIDDQPLPPEQAERAEYAKRYSTKDDNGFRIEVNMHSYWKNVSNSLEEAATATLNSIRTENGVSELDYKSCAVLQRGMQGILMEGEYLYKDAIRLVFRNLIMVQGPHRWQVNITYREDDKVGEKVAIRILKSVRLR
jgi:hypothetical protein